MSQPKYQVLERIDAGGMAEVFKANSTSMQGFQKLVAIKRILPELTKKPRFIRMFLDEAKVSLHLNHNNCVQIFDLGRAGDTYFIVMEFVDGTNLKHIIEDLHRHHEMMAVEHAVYIAIEICKGLAHAHNKRDLAGEPLKIVHRDISPPNVLVSIEGEVKITDFGLAKAQSQVEITDPGVVKGKFGYLSPEAADGELVDHRTDIFAVGILIWEMLVGKRLFLGKTDYDTLALVQRAKISPVSNHRSDVPVQLEQIIERALARDPQRRYQDAQSLTIALAEFLFSYGRPVTSFEIANMVLRTRQGRAGEQRRAAVDSGIQEAVQKEINKMVSLEEVDDLDAYLAEHYASMSSQEDIPAADSDRAFEDPSQWADFGFGPSEAMNDFVPAIGEEGSEGWMATDLNELVSNSNSGAHNIAAMRQPKLRHSDYPDDDDEVGHGDATVQITPEKLASINIDQHYQNAGGVPTNAQRQAELQQAQHYNQQGGAQHVLGPRQPQQPQQAQPNFGGGFHQGGAQPLMTSNAQQGQATAVQSHQGFNTPATQPGQKPAGNKLILIGIVVFLILLAGAGVAVVLLQG